MGWGGRRHLLVYNSNLLAAIFQRESRETLHADNSKGIIEKKNNKSNSVEGNGPK